MRVSVIVCASILALSASHCRIWSWMKRYGFLAMFSLVQVVCWRISSRIAAAVTMACALPDYGMRPAQVAESAASAARRPNDILLSILFSLPLVSLFLQAGKQKGRRFPTCF